MDRFSNLIMTALAALLVSGAAAQARPVEKSPSDMAEIQRAGERIYRQGVLSDGSVLAGAMRGEAIDGTIFSCANCHARGGLGSVEGQITSPAVNGASLFTPRYLLKDQIKNKVAKDRGGRSSSPQIRPPYTAQSLAEAIRSGIDPSGRKLHPIMPRYTLGDRDMELLIGYLGKLSSQYSPGVTDTALRFATIITDDVTPADREAMLAPLETLVTINRQLKTQKKLPQFAKMFRMLDSVYFREISIARWELTGPPESWRGQLEEYYRKEPVFAILGGISGGSWQPMHDFCEQLQIPCLFPITDLPVISSDSWYTLYASKGYYQEGETAARFLAERQAPPEGWRLLQIVAPGPEGEALCAGFTKQWQGAGSGVLETVRLEGAGQLNPGELARLVRTHRPTTVLIWSGPELTQVLQDITDLLPDLVLSSRYLGGAMLGLPEALRGRTYLTYPYRLPEDEKRFAGYDELLLLNKPRQKDEKRIASRTFSMVHLFLQGLKELKLDFYRDTLLDVIGMLPDQNLPDFERLSFGPGQRYASKGCYMVQLGPGVDPKLIRKSEWVVY